MTTIRHAVQLETRGKEASYAPTGYEKVAELLDWLARHLRQTKKDVIGLPVFTIRTEDSNQEVYGLSVVCKTILRTE